MQGNKEKLNAFLVKNKVLVKDILKVSHEGARFNSYKVSVSVIDFHRLLNEDFWPNGIQCKKWYERKMSNVDANVTDDVFSNDINNDYISRRTYDRVNSNSNSSQHG